MSFYFDGEINVIPTFYIISLILFLSAMNYNTFYFMQNVREIYTGR